MGQLELVLHPLFFNDLFLGVFELIVGDRELPVLGLQIHNRLFVGIGQALAELPHDAVGNRGIVVEHFFKIMAGELPQGHIGARPHHCHPQSGRVDQTELADEIPRLADRDQALVLGAECFDDLHFPVVNHVKMVTLLAFPEQDLTSMQAADLHLAGKVFQFFLGKRLKQRDLPEILMIHIQSSAP